MSKREDKFTEFFKAMCDTVIVLKPLKQPSKSSMKDTKEQPTTNQDKTNK